MGLMLAEQMDVKSIDDPMAIQQFLNSNNVNSSLTLYKSFSNLIFTEAAHFQASLKELTN